MKQRKVPFLLLSALALMALVPAASAAAFADDADDAEQTYYTSDGGKWCERAMIRVCFGCVVTTCLQEPDQRDWLRLFDLNEPAPL